MIARIFSSMLYFTLSEIVVTKFYAAYLDLQPARMRIVLFHSYWRTIGHIRVVPLLHGP